MLRGVEVGSKDFHPQPKSPAGWRKVADRGPVGILNGVISKHDSAEFITVESKSKHDLAERSAGVSRAHQHRVGAIAIGADVTAALGAHITRRPAVSRAGQR